MVDGRDRETGRFKTGNSGGGRPRGARNKLGESFVQALADDFIEHGIGAVARVRAQDPSTYLKIIGNTLPKEVLMQAVSITASLDLSEIESARGFFAAYSYAREKIGAEAPAIDLSPEAEAAWTTDYPDDD
jgi:hypothetical protein